MILLVGEKISNFLDSDIVFDWEITPNRPDWLSHIGIAREIASIASVPLTLPENKLAESDQSVHDLFNIQVSAPDLCPRYTARIVKDVRIGPSPYWMQQYLSNVGLRSINNVVDITNYILMECGQPLHAFDLNLLSGGKIIIRHADDGECFTALDGQSYELTINNLVISDLDKNLALAGVIGGGNSENI